MGVNLTTDITVDSLARPVLTLGPAFLSPLPVSQSQNEAGSASGALVQVRAATFNVYRDVEHEVWTASGYATGSAPGEYVYTLQNPVAITRMDHDGRAIDSIQAVRARSTGFSRNPLPPEGGTTSGFPRRPAPHEFVESPGALSAGDSFPQSSFVRWTQNIYNDAHDLVATRRYTNIPLSGPGREGENYNETRFGYDLMQRQNKLRAPGGTIERTVFDVRDNPIDTWVGTDDSGATDEAPDGVGAPGNNMRNTATNIYDNSDTMAPVGGDNLLTSVVRHIDFTPDNDYRSDFYHDFRHRRTGTVEWIDVSQGKFLFTSQTFDNNDNVTQVQQFNSTTDTTDTTAIVRQSGTSFDYLQRPYQTQRAGVNALTAQYLFSEGSGSSTADNSGNGYTAALEGAAGWGTPGQGSSPHCLDISSGGYVDCGAIPAAADGFRVSAWIKTTWDGSGGFAQRVIASHIAGDDVGRPGRLDAAR